MEVNLVLQTEQISFFCRQPLLFPLLFFAVGALFQYSYETSALPKNHCMPNLSAYAYHFYGICSNRHITFRFRAKKIK